ncbi:MAG TPA: glutamate 5-kinase [Candidatus Hydrogenedentes bacterium]|jgi:glutamate 5-kinase|nr:glutamate 5-kinase [Candidatus Hydrogenedentota bacterium]HOD95236.1 glutamate 5-kinase [Candidatus Hydrogenedentota bacterium]HOH42638.1 glutamate 5-kinase [Candidatus Hydrogenedentota bacterium]HOM47658.1 glutamate 5-kinase [Candidatus Hydrogenedentota bacterium]HOR50664.1 glutamate 5-kinase [Candidatus Hydrogenedentota bacterium]
MPSKASKRIVVKIGTNLLTGRRAFDGHILEGLVQEIVSLKQDQGMDVLIVTSGAVGCGMDALGLVKRPTALPEKQAVAAVGQARLMHYYETLFRVYGKGMTTAQILLTQADLDSRQNYLNIRNTLSTLFTMKSVVPVVNENDSTATEELRFGDNDTLAAKIAAKANADLLIILTDVDGLFDKDPREDPTASLIREVTQITDEIEALAGGAGSIASTGGMRTKLQAAKIAVAAGVDCIITSGYRKRVLHQILAGEAPHTNFRPAKVALSHRKRWIAFGRSICGTLHVDAGATAALVEKGKSLLPVGVQKVEGRFGAGAAVRIVDDAGAMIACGLANYDSETIDLLKGKKTEEITSILGHNDYDEIVHRDNLVLMH